MFKRFTDIVFMYKKIDAFTAKVERGFVICKSHIIHPFSMLVSFTFYGGYKGYNVNHIGHRYINTVCIMAEYSKTNILDLSSSSKKVALSITYHD